MSTTILLVHGAWHGAWCWRTVEDELRARGVETVTVDLPSCGTVPGELGGMNEDAATVAAALETLSGDVTVCAHSYGGIPITEAVTAARRLVYLAAFMPDVGQSLVSLLPPGSLPPFVEPRDELSVAFSPAFARQTLYGDCSDEVAADATNRLVLHSTVAITTPVTRAAWRDLPSTYVVCEQDAIIPPDAQRSMASRATDTVALEASHSPQLSRPVDVAAILAS